MPTPSIHPDRLTTRLVWRNRVDGWASHRPTALLQGGALVAIAALMLLAVWPLRPGTAALLTHLQTTAPVLTASAVAALALAHHLHRLSVWREAQQAGWLANQPVPDRLHAQARRDLVLRGLAGHGLATLLAWPWLGLVPDDAPGLALLLAAAAAPALPLDTRLAARASRHMPTRVRSAAGTSTGPGRLWRWQWLAARGALRGRALAVTGWLLLLLPAGASAPSIAVAFAVGALLVILLQAWQRSVAVLPEIQRRFAAQPLSGRWLLRHGSALPLAVLAAVLLLMAGLGTALGRPTQGLLAGLALTATGLLQGLVVLALRDHPARATLAFAVQLALLLGVLQALPPLVPILWAGQYALWLRRTLAS